MDVSLTQLRSKLAQGLRGGCFFLHGSDAFLKSEAVPWIVDAHLDPGSREFNLEVLRSDAATAETLSAAVATPPIAAPYRAIVLKDVQELIPSARSALESLLGRLPPDVALVTTAEIPKGSKAKFYDALRKAGVAVRCEPPPESALPGLLMERAEAQHGLNLEPDAAALLVSSFGRALGALAEELEKLADYVAPRERIGVEDVRAVAGALPRTTRWGWIDLVLDREFDRARDELRSLLDSGESGVGLVAGLGEALVRVGLAAGGHSSARSSGRAPGDIFTGRSPPCGLGRRRGRRPWSSARSRSACGPTGF